MPTGHNHILLIEDDPDFAQTLQEGLENEGYTVTWSATGNEGLASAHDHGPDLILLDIRHPATRPLWPGRLP